ncbi:MAG: TRAP transporter substrate-binding protein [Proteobacteria bacterium]|nr:TRAP transporter substrate-binding protein [Pseudomonadota bacterium]
MAKKNLFVRQVSLVLITIVTVTFLPIATMAKELKLAHFMPPVHTLQEKVFTPLAEELAKATGGDLTIAIYPAGALGKGPVQQYKRAVEGVADITFAIHSYTAELFPRSQLVTLPGAYTNAEEGTQKLWAILDPYLKEEYRDIKLLGLWAMSPTVLITKDRPVATLADLKGMKVRTGSPGEADAVLAWGGVAVTMPITESYNALNTGIVDAVLIQPSAIYKPWNLFEPGKYVTDLLPSPSTIVFLAMNRQSWDALNPSQQAALEKLTGREFSMRAAVIWSEMDVEALGRAETDPEIKRIALTAEQQKAFAQAVEPVIEAELARLEKEGINAGEIYKAIKP